ncbi:N-acetyltransferase [Mesorhizobium hawassense]|uniref:N-acetyltransferase n=1 Tax=Mesorhizobium hawassense TaxID=1209954 RepID=A0A330HVU1_9HYPH|nr:N-acetyltransferase [Mesorhizobium hawassense]RAZ91790.1 N-acetyltransferase [Mesorhizobium hawassense]
MDAEVKDNPVMHRFELSPSGDELAVSYYKEKDGRVILLHTEVPQPPSFNNSYAHLQDRFFARRSTGWLESPDGIERRCHVI